MTLELQETKVSTAVSLVLSLAKKEKTNDVLCDETVPIRLQISVKKIPPKQKLIKLKLPHAIASPDGDICLFVKDVDKSDSEQTIAHFEEQISMKGVKNIKEIVPVKALKTDYKPFEAKRNLSSAYDIYLADQRIVTCLPRLLGKDFYGHKRIPTQVNVLAKDLQKEINRAISTRQFKFSGKGSSSMAEVGNSGMTAEQLTANVLEAVSQITKAVPGFSSNIKQLQIKTKSSPCVPIYLAEGGPQDVKIKKERKHAPKAEVGELSTLMDGNVAVYPDGRVLVLKNGQTVKDVTKVLKRTESAKRKREEDVHKTEQIILKKRKKAGNTKPKTVNKLKKTKRSDKSK